jgi:hypothetical protein
MPYNLKLQKSVNRMKREDFLNCQKPPIIKPTPKRQIGLIITNTLMKNKITSEYQNGCKQEGEIIKNLAKYRVPTKKNENRLSD